MVSFKRSVEGAEEMTIKPVVRVSDGKLVVKERTILTGIQENVVETSTIEGMFLGVDMEKEDSRHIVSLGTLRDVRTSCDLCLGLEEEKHAICSTGWRRCCRRRFAQNRNLIVAATASSSAHGGRNTIVACGVSGNDRCRRRQFWSSRGRHDGVGHVEDRAAANEGGEET
ncbi:hypothetical protein LR48_Vigan2424s000100 [Vigna angularis]|nr:hypothetical protein LR48_Vigan2424s000100 [Vigna angularis]